MAKFRESAYVNDFVMFRNACEERKLRSTLSYIDRLKTNYHKQQDKDKLFFAVQHLSVPSRRNQHAGSSRSEVATRSVSAPTAVTNMPSKGRGSKHPGKLLQKRQNYVPKTFQTEVLPADNAATNKLTPPTNDLKVTERRQSHLSQISKSSGDVKKSITSSKYGDFSRKDENNIHLVNLTSVLRAPKPSNSVQSLPPLPSKEEWERKISSMKPTMKTMNRREKQAVAQEARNKWRNAFENMKNRRLTLYQSKISSTTGDKETTFVKFLPKNQQAFYIKDVQFAQKFL